MIITTKWNPQTHADYDVLKGFDVYSSDGEKVGTIEQVFHPQLDMPQARGNHFFLVKPGTLRSLFGADEVYLPESAIDTVADDRVVLSFPKDSLQDRGWTTKPADWQSFRRA